MGFRQSQSFLAQSKKSVSRWDSERLIRLKKVKLWIKNIKRFEFELLLLVLMSEMVRGLLVSYLNNDYWLYNRRCSLKHSFKWRLSLLKFWDFLVANFWYENFSNHATQILENFERKEQNLSRRFFLFKKFFKKKKTSKKDQQDSWYFQKRELYWVSLLLFEELK